MLAASVVLYCNSARADLAVGGDLDLAWPRGAWPGKPAGTGVGFHFRLGWAPQTARLLLSPEIKAGYLRFSDGTAARQQRLAYGATGLRLGYRGRLSAALLMHLGYGGRRGLDEDAGLATLRGLLWDVGMGLDLELIKGLSVGCELLLHELRFSGTDARARWLALGLHAGLSL